jgi:exopolysaccharide production protein ExoZ
VTFTGGIDARSGSRIDSLDYLRGLLAVAVMAYHYATGSGLNLDSSHVLGRIGIYAVATFYILSGLSLGVVYRGNLNTIRDIAAYAIKRIFRIVPLFWFVVTASVAVGMLTSAHHGLAYKADGRSLLLNYTLLFGFVDPSAYLSVGAWSIGNETVFYALFPLILIATGRNRMTLSCVACAAFLVALYFAEVLLDPALPLASQWAVYVNPFNQLFLFACGVLMSGLSCPIAPRWRLSAMGVALIGVAAFVMLPSAGDEVALVTGANRFLFSGACVLLVLGLFLSDLRIRGRAGKILAFLGKSSYAIYLLHPLVVLPLLYLFRLATLPSSSAYIVAAAATLAVAWVSFNYLEEPMMKMGGRFGRSVRARQEPTPTDMQGQ